MAIEFSEEERGCPTHAEWQLYRDVMLENYRHLLFLGENNSFQISQTTLRVSFSFEDCLLDDSSLHNWRSDHCTKEHT